MVFTSIPRLRNPNSKIKLFFLRIRLETYNCNVLLLIASKLQFCESLSHSNYSEMRCHIFSGVKCCQQRKWRRLKMFILLKNVFSHKKNKHFILIYLNDVIDICLSFCPYKIYAIGHLKVFTQHNIDSLKKGLYASAVSFKSIDSYVLVGTWMLQSLKISSFFRQ